MAATTLAVSVLLTACWAFTPSPRLLVMATAFVPFALVGYAVAALGWWFVRRWVPGARRRVRVGVLGALVASAVGVVLHAALLAPAYVGSHAAGRPALTVMTVNLRLGQADTGQVQRLAAREDVDVVVLEEATPRAVSTLTRLRRDLPHVAGRAMPGARGTVVLSRYPLEQVTPLWIFQGTWTMRVAAPQPFHLVAVHTSHPVNAVHRWRGDHRILHRDAASALRKGAVVMAGDFNATLDHRTMRALLDLGLADAARQSNEGWQPTWPGGIGVLALDHVLVSRQFSTISTRTHRIAGSDHRAVVVDLAVR